MGKSSKSLFIGALASTLFSGVAFAADYIPPPIVDFEPEFELELGGNLYLRGYVGFTNQEVDSLYNAQFNNAAVLEFLNSEFESSGLVGGAIGYRFNQWFRADISAEYRMRAGYDGLDRYDTTGDGTWDGTNQYTADKSEFLVMANAFVDLGTYHGLTPYVGAGVGGAYIMLDNFTDTNNTVSPNTVSYGGDNGEWSLAWALHAGLGFEVSEQVTLDLGYRYLSLGDGQAGDIITALGTNNIANPTDFNDITSHDFTLGFRYALGGFGGGHSSGYGHSSY